MLLWRVGAPSFFLLHSIPLCKCTTVFFDPLIYWWAPQLLPAIGYCNCVAMNIGVHRFFWIGVSGLLGYNPSNDIAGSKGSSIFSFLRKFRTVFPVAVPVCIPTNSVLGFPFLHNLSNTCLLIWLWWSFWPVWNVSNLGFNLHLSDG